MKARLELSLARTFTARHALPGIGFPEPHEHTYELRCGYVDTVSSDEGCTRPLQELEREVDAVVEGLQGNDLNAVLPVTPTAEMLVCWILAQLPERWEWASITAYGGYTCKLRRSDLT